MSALEKIVFSYPKIQERLTQKGESSKDSSKDIKEKVLKNLAEIKADFSQATIKTFEKMLDATMAKLYDGINLDHGGCDFKQLVKDNSVVLVPNHQSHADYVAINYKVFKEYGIPLHVAGGNNLNIFPIGTLFRKSGCFFIRRSFQNDILYKLTLEAYLYYLLMEQKPIEFFFEGGRSRTGKLLPPRYGLYQMLLEAHSLLPEDKKKPLIFLPVSIAHEYVPEQRSLAKELRGGKKKKESTTQLFGLVKLISYQFGNVHIRFGEPVQAQESIEDIKVKTQDLAFECFRRVGKNMVVTPTSLLAMVLLDEPIGALKWVDIQANCRHTIEFCKRFQIPLTESLSGQKWEDALGRALDIMIANHKVDIIGKSKRGHVFYSIKDDCRAELLYFKNTILHHFLIPWTVNSAWFNLFNGNIQNVEDLKRNFLSQRDQLKHEFYLPTVKEFFKKTFDIISWCVGREIRSLDECMDLSHKELYSILSHIGIFTRSCHYIFEAYYVAALSLRSLHEERPDGFKMEEFEKRLKVTFESERELDRVIKFPESYSLPLMKNSIKYFSQQQLVEQNGGVIKLVDPDVMDAMIQTLEEDLTEQLRFNLRAQL